MYNCTLWLPARDWWGETNLSSLYTLGQVPPRGTLSQAVGRVPTNVLSSARSYQLAGDQVDHPPVEIGTPGGSPSRCELEMDDTGREHTHGQHMGITHLQQAPQPCRMPDKDQHYVLHINKWLACNVGGEWFNGC